MTHALISVADHDTLKSEVGRSRHVQALGLHLATRHSAVMYELVLG